jgi:glycosyltransferase involved in cell wall biosynthesis
MSPADIWHLHLHDTYDRLGIASLGLRRRFGPAVITEHLPRNHASDERLERQNPRTPGAAMAKTAFKRLEFSQVRRVILVSRGSETFVKERYGLSADRMSVVHNGIDASAIEPSRPPLGARMSVVSVGALGRQKGHDVLLEAAARARGDWELTIVGDGSQSDSLRRRAADLPDGRVRLAGWVDDPQHQVEKSDVVCMPSRWEAFPYAALEASAMARPLVASRVDGLEEIVLHGETGILVRPGQPGELADALDELSAKPELIVQLGSAARARVQRCYDMDRMVSGVMDVYAQALA